MDRTEDVPVGAQDIRLGQLLKLVGAADSGGAVKQLLCEGQVRVNGRVEKRRGAHLSPGDVITSGGQRWRMG